MKACPCSIERVNLGFQNQTTTGDASRADLSVKLTSVRVRSICVSSKWCVAMVLVGFRPSPIRAIQPHSGAASKAGTPYKLGLIDHCPFVFDISRTEKPPSAHGLHCGLCT